MDGGLPVLKRRASIELGLVLLTAALHFVFQGALHLDGPYIAAAVLFWTGYLVFRAHAPEQARAWGLRRDTLAPSLLANGLVLAIAGPGMVVFGVLRGRGSPPPSSLYFLLALYPVWGLIQQFIICALVGKNLEAILGSRGWAVVVGAILFGAVHLPNWTLVALTAAACAVWMSLFLRWPNLWVHGISHGWLGSLAYIYVLGQDPWEDILKALKI
jgi:uncharacterized protein